MNQLLCCIPFHKSDAKMAENLLDYLYVLNGKRQNGYVLLACADDVHQEVVEVMKIAASLAFESVDCIRVSKFRTNTKDIAINGMFKGVAHYVASHYRVPWFWCEPDLTPIKSNWLMQLAGEYYNQPRRYCGSLNRLGETVFPARCIVYPPDAINDLGKFCNDSVAYNFNSSLLPMITRSRLIREIPIASIEDWDKVPKDVIACHSDKNGIALAACEVALEKKAARNVAARVSA
jgi:hypothetical protein